MIVVAILIMANLAFDLKPDVVGDLIESAVLLAGGVYARSKVSPTATDEAVADMEGNDV
jgi:hypothetical protein